MEDRMADPARKKHTFMIGLEKLNTLNAEGCPACGHKFTLGETVVLACGAWGGAKLIHENEAVWDSRKGRIRSSIGGLLSYVSFAFSSVLSGC
jgi:hypothetical protein